MNPEEFKRRTLNFGLAAIRLCESLPKKPTSDVIGRQLLRSAVSVGANYRSACRAKSTADFISKMGTVEEESDEVSSWLELLEKSGVVEATKAKPLQLEANEITAMVVASIRTAKANRSR